MTAQSPSLVSIVMKNRFLKFGVPFLLLVVGGSFGLREFASLRYQYSTKSGLVTEEMARLGLMKPGKVTLESEYESIKKINIDDWENKRGPRPWEENQEK